MVPLKVQVVSAHAAWMAHLNVVMAHTRRMDDRQKLQVAWIIGDVGPGTRSTVDHHSVDVP